SCVVGVPAGVKVRWRSALIGTAGYQDLAFAAGGHGRHQSGHLHGLQHARGAVIAYAQVALHQGDACLVVFHDHGHGAVVHGVSLGVVIPIAQAIGVGAAAVEHTFHVVGLALLLEEFDHAQHFVVAHKGTVHAL